MIKIISALQLHDNKLTCKDRIGKIDEIALIQGNIDGACAVYSLMMALLIERCIRFCDVRVYAKHNDPKTRKLFKALLEDSGMHFKGESFPWIIRRINDTISGIVEAHHKILTNEDSIVEISKNIDEDHPVIMSVHNRRLSHAMLAIGYEYNADDEIVKIFCLDPSGEKPKYTYWNAVIDIVGNKYTYFNHDNKPEKVLLDDLITIDKIKK